MRITESLLKKILVDSDLISQKDFELAKEKAKNKKEPLEKTIEEEGLISDEELGQLIADQIGAPFINLKKVKINREILNIVPEIVAKKQKIIVFAKVKEDWEGFLIGKRIFLLYNLTEQVERNEGYYVVSSLQN